MITSFYIVQHAEKERTAGDPPLTARGHVQARLTARYLGAISSCAVTRPRPGTGEKNQKATYIASMYSSPLRRARETAHPIAEELGLSLRIDERLRERMNWGDGPDSEIPESFLEEWERATRDRDFKPRSGDSSRHAGDRFESVLRELSSVHRGESAVIVAHGGITLDLLRNLFGDEQLRSLDPHIIKRGVPACAITYLTSDGSRYNLRELASVKHLSGLVHIDI